MSNHDLRKRRLPRIPMTGATLKIYGCITMILYSVSMSVIQYGLLHTDAYSNLQLHELLAANPELMIVSSWGAVLQLLGGLAVPVFAFLLVEGFRHTRSFKNYILRMLLFALISEVPFDLAMSGSFFDFTRQNAMFTLVICLVMLYGIRTFAAGKLAQVAIVGAAVLWCALLKTDFGFGMVLLTAAYQLFYDNRQRKLTLGCIISILYVTAPLSTYAISKYEGERGNIRWPLAWYCLYPLHLCILAVIVHFLR